MQRSSCPSLADAQSHLDSQYRVHGEGIVICHYRHARYMLLVLLFFLYLPSENLGNVLKLLHDARCDEKAVGPLNGVQIFPYQSLDYIGRRITKYSCVCWLCAWYEKLQESCYVR